MPAPGGARLGFGETRGLLTRAQRPRATPQPARGLWAPRQGLLPSGWVLSVLSPRTRGARVHVGTAPRTPGAARHAVKSHGAVTSASPEQGAAAAGVGMFPRAGGCPHPGRPRGTPTLPHAGTRPGATRRRRPQFRNSAFDLEFICSPVHSQGAFPRSHS